MLGQQRQPLHIVRKGLFVHGWHPSWSSQDLVETFATANSDKAKFKAEVMAACERPGVSVAEVSRRYGLNTNLVQTWRRQARQQEAVVSPERSANFVPVVCTEPSRTPAPGDIRLDIRYRGAEVAIQARGISIGLCAVIARMALMIRVEALWLSAESLDMRAGIESILARVVRGLWRGAAAPCSSLCQSRGTRMKIAPGRSLLYCQIANTRLCYR